METIKAVDLPDSIEEVWDDILQKAVICEKTWRPFRIVKPELEFYRKHWLPLPRKHPDVRYSERIQKTPNKQLYLRHCDKCWKEMLSVYDEKYPGKVYCEACYNKEIYG